MKQKQSEINLKTFHEDTEKKRALQILDEWSMDSDDFFQEKSPNSLLIFSKSRVKRSDDDEITLVEATAKENYAYWLSQEDIVDIARIEYNNYKGLTELTEHYSEFEVLGSISQLSTQIENFQLKLREFKTGRCTYIINLEGLHWVTLVIFYKNNHYKSYYIDSKNNPFPFEYHQLFLDRIGEEPLNIAPGEQQTDGYNCAFWALENAADLNELLDNNRSLNWLISKFTLPRDQQYFDRRRQLLSEKLRADPAWRERHLLLPFGFSIASSSIDDDRLNDPKQLGFKLQQEDATVLQEVFTEAFISVFIKRLAAFHLAAKGERLTEETLKTELTAGTTGTLLGVSISQNIIGSIPSLVASIRVLSNKYYIPNKGKARRITKVFSKLTPGDLSPILSEAAIDIFYSFESQFMQITDKAGDRVAMEKLAEDAADRALNYIEKLVEVTSIDKDLLEQAILSGPSEKFFDPSVKRARLRISGSKLQDKIGNNINTANLYEKVGLVVVDDAHPHQRLRFYANKEHPDSNRYGYRRLLDWEKGQNGEIKENLKEHYQENSLPHEETIFQFNSRNYNYVLGRETTQQVAQTTLNKIQNRFPVVEKDRLQQTTTKNPILFNLNKPIQNFAGRVKLLKELHKMLILGRTTAVVPALSTLSIDSMFDTPSILSSGSQVSVSGLGGIGKTQLALRYAELYANAYDHNVLWINAETKENLFHSFHKLATKLGLETRNRYGQKKNMDGIIEEVYEYFSDRKSLFIFDNVENYRAIAAYLPKSMLGNKPTLLITSRYSHWEDIASVLSLDVFTEQESKELIKNSLGLQHNHDDEKIIELNHLLQGLPLALQQAIAYIKLRRSADASFSLNDYIELYKQASRELLDFDFSHYSNDPYLKTVFTTWRITLDKIQSDPIVGNDAIKVLSMIAYLDPDNISSSLFNYWQNNHLVATIFSLLKSYSMINLENQENKYTIHRLVQQVTRINLERDIVKFRAIAREIETLFVSSIHNAENNFHFMHFLLYMSEYREIKHLFLYSETSTILFDHLVNQDIRFWVYFLDLAYLKFPKQKYLNFLGDAIAFCIKKISLFFLPELLSYIENKWITNKLSKENVKYIINYVSTVKGTVYSLSRFSRIPAKKEKQLAVIKIIYDFKVKIFQDVELYEACASHSLKRAINLCALSERDNEKIFAVRNQALKLHLQKVTQVSRWISSGLFTKDTLSALLQGELRQWLLISD
jgi:NB-ARC domain